MPITPLHYCAAYLIARAKRGFVLPALIVGAVIPDIEPVISLATLGNIEGRGFLHSLLGAVTLDTFIAVLATIFLYPPLVSWIFRLDKKSVVEKCRFSGMLVLSTLVGTLSHVLIDVTSHEYNPLLYPFTKESFDALVLFNNWLLASDILHIVFFALLLLIFINELRKGTSGFWKRLLLG